MINKTNTKNIGKLPSGKVLIFGGVYSNFQALQKIKAMATALDIPNTQIICTGDILGYCAQPNECLELIRDWNIHTIAGNVELQIREDEDECGCNFSEGSRCDLLSQNWYAFTQKQISADNKEWLFTLPEFLRFEFGGKKCFVLHGGLENTSQFIFNSTDWKIKADILDATGADVILSGHCGLPFHDYQENKYWINPGVIGMPANDGTARVWYGILENQRGKINFSHQSMEYDHETAATFMKQKGLPSTYAETLSTGLWDNMEILEEEEKLLRGKALNL